MESAKVGTKLPWLGIEGTRQAGHELVSSYFGYFRTMFWTFKINKNDNNKKNKNGRTKNKNKNKNEIKIKIKNEI